MEQPTQAVVVVVAAEAQAVHPEPWVVRVL
jgi:hypothetical protein